MVFLATRKSQVKDTPDPYRTCRCCCSSNNTNASLELPAQNFTLTTSASSPQIPTRIDSLLLLHSHPLHLPTRTHTHAHTHTQPTKSIQATSKMAPTISFLQSTHDIRTTNALCKHKFQVISPTRSVCTETDCTATRTHPDLNPDAAAIKTTPVSGMFVAQPVRRNPVLREQRYNLVTSYADIQVPYCLSDSKAEQVLDNLFVVAERVDDDDGLLPEL